ncbi:L,D-transpeptidase family protein [Paucibacter sp. M5-1]|uniref:L,D-transpeptidase family protein n=1 Tax=Paucibacter sp. M5-1 TaxID=3015998 RepID=UPI0022B85CEE|nr:L,D-transpeptidase family protein [Paucibacter sp. M5-1]MCZ7884041.1 L,D-transpeptidase family protein [Paucibacter sp. M5-1]
MIAEPKPDPKLEPRRPTARCRLRSTAAALLLGMALAAGAEVPFWGERKTQAVDLAPDQLAHGQWVWSPQLAPSGPVLVFVDLQAQLAYVYRNALLIGYSTISSGRKGFETPTGVFHTLQKDRHHRSSIYNSAPMPYTQRLTWGGIALHAGGLPGYPSSHGCVHLPSAFAEQLFEASPMGMTVVVAKGAGIPPSGPVVPLLTTLDAKTGEPLAQPRLPAGDAYRVMPGPSEPQAPLALVVSLADARLLVLRAGVEIARSRIATTALPKVAGTHAYVALRDAAEPSLRWVGLAVPGHADAAGSVIDAQTLAAAQLPAEFLAQIQPMLHEGTTLVVTDAPVLAQTTGVMLTVLSNQPPMH